MKENNESEDCFLMQPNEFIIQINELIKMLTNEFKNFKQEQQLESYTVQQVANIFKASKNSIYNMIETGQLNAFRIGTKDSKKATLRISKQALEEYIANNSTKASIKMNDKGGVK